jgi:uroporphyrinogen-III synthase
MLPVIVIRPEPGCARTVVAAREAGMKAHGFPLFAVRPAAWSPPDPSAIDALLIGSANALRHGGAGLEAFRGFPAHVVGAATAEAAQAAGLRVESVGEGGLQTVLDIVDPARGRLLRLAGRERVALAPPAGVTLTERLVYASEPLDFQPALTELLRAPALVLLHSGEAARHFAALVDAAGLVRKPIRIAAIGPRVSEQAGTGWAEVRAADRADDAALLALAARMCQS